jgi:hypothetical protein
LVGGRGLGPRVRVRVRVSIRASPRRQVWDFWVGFFGGSGDGWVGTRW